MELTGRPPNVDRRWYATAVVGLTLAAAVAVGLLYIPVPSDWMNLLFVFALVGLLETRGGVGFRIGKGSVSFNAKAYASIGSVFILGLPAAAASAIAALLMGVALRRELSLKMVFNSSMALLMFAAAYSVFHELLPLTGGFIVLLLVAGAIGGTCAWLANHSLLGLVLVADGTSRNFKFGAYVSYSLSLAPYFVGYGLAGLGAYAAGLWLSPIGGLLTLAAPVAIVQTVTNRWMRAQQAVTAEAQSGFNATLVSLSKAIDLRDSDTEGHCRRVVEYSLMMGRHLKFSDDDLLRLCHGALLHDIGKIGVPDAILHKPGPLTDEEWDIMRTHPQLGALLVADVRQLEKAREVILAHHERYDGKGYPRGLAGDSVPLAARVFTIADAFDAMISDRPYRKAMTLPEAREEVRRCSGTQFDPLAVAAFESLSDSELAHIANEKEQPSEELLSLV